MILKFHTYVYSPDPPKPFTDVCCDEEGSTVCGVGFKKLTPPQKGIRLGQIQQFGQYWFSNPTSDGSNRVGFENRVGGPADFTVSFAGQTVLVLFVDR